MTSRSTAIWLLFSVLFLFTACQPKNEMAFDDGAENNDVLLAGEEGFEMPLSASFSSDAKHFAYALFYDGAVLRLTDSNFPGASVMGANFKVQGGGSIGTQTFPVAQFQNIESRAGQAVQVGLYSVYRYQEQAKIAGQSCALDFALVPYGEEALRFQLTTCGGEDPGVGLMALDTLLEGLEIH